PEPAGLRVERVGPFQVPGAGDGAGALGLAGLAAELGLGAGIDDLPRPAPLQLSQELLPRRQTGRVPGEVRLRGRDLRLLLRRLAARGQPAFPAAVEHADVLDAPVAQDPPGPRRGPRAVVVVDNHGPFPVDAQLAEALDPPFAALCRVDR